MILDRFKLDEKKAVVTGAGRGIGRGLAFALAEAGADVANFRVAFSADPGDGGNLSGTVNGKRGISR